jgi:hypothetical protein
MMLQVIFSLVRAIAGKLLQRRYADRYLQRKRVTDPR